MAVLLTIEGQYTTPSTVAGKLDLMDFDIELAYPIKIDEDDYGSQKEAMFYIKNFLLKKILKKKYKAKFKGLREVKITVVEDMDEEQIKKSLESKELLAIDPYSLTASEINKFKDNEIFWTLVLMDGDNTFDISKKKSLWTGTDMNDKRNKLKEMLGIQEAVEQVVSKDVKKKSALFKAAGKSASKESGGKANRKRPTRKSSTPSVKVYE